jgi:uncharacterized protein YbaR (Trm112 family)
MKNRRNYYRVLQVQPDAPLEIIRASYRTMMKELKQHPDLGGGTYGAAVLNEAYEVLSNPVRRAAYDKELYGRYSKKALSQNNLPIDIVLCPVCKRPVEQKPRPGDACPSCKSPLQSQKQADLEQACRRSLERTRRDDRIQYYSVWPGKARQAEMVDFSPKGMRFLCSERLAPRTVLKISSRFFEASAAVTNVCAEEIDGREMFAVGVCFIAISFVESKGTFFSTSG